MGNATGNRWLTGVFRFSLLMICVSGCRRSDAAPRHDLPAAASDRNRFTLQDITRRPFQKVTLWAPPAGSPGNCETLILLHGNQRGSGDATWMAGLRLQPQLSRRLLIVPALDDGHYDFDAPTNTTAIAALVGDVAQHFPVERDGVYVLGYSAGASRVLSVASGLSNVRGIIAIAGDIGRSLRQRLAAVKKLRAIPILLVCMSDDSGPQTSCRLNEANRARLQRLGFARVEMRRVPGTHELDFAVIAPLLDDWLLGVRKPNAPDPVCGTP
jgi:predicted esterase